MLVSFHVFGFDVFGLFPAPVPSGLGAGESFMLEVGGSGRADSHPRIAKKKCSSTFLQLLHWSGNAKIDVKRAEARQRRHLCFTERRFFAPRGHLAGAAAANLEGNWK